MGPARFLNAVMAHCGFRVLLPPIPLSIEPTIEVGEKAIPVAADVLVGVSPRSVESVVGDASCPSKLCSEDIHPDSVDCAVPADVPTA
jgi:hypothetical protein